MKERIKELHSDYNNIYELQKKLPSKRGKRDLTDIENEVRTKAFGLMQKCSITIQEIRINEEAQKYLDEVKNIYDGASQIQQNPYLKIGGKVDLT